MNACGYDNMKAKVCLLFEFNLELAIFKRLFGPVLLLNSLLFLFTKLEATALSYA
jgi:hypothetical protein